MGRTGRWGMRPGYLALAAVLVAGLSRPADAQPGVEKFAKPPETPLELWDAVDYLVRIGRADQAVPFLQRFVAANPDDATMLKIREEYGVGSLLRLEDNAPTVGQGRRLLQRMQQAAARSARDPERLKGLAELLLATPEERAVGTVQLGASGAFAVPPILEVLQRPGLTDEQRAGVAESLGHLDRRALPPIAAALESPDANVAAAAAKALGVMGDTRAVPFLIHASATPDASRASVRDAAARSLGLLGGTPTGTAGAALTAEAMKYLGGGYSFPKGTVDVWEWDGASSNVKPRPMSPSQAASTLGLKFARWARGLQPNDRDAQVAELALMLGDDALASEAAAAATAAGPSVMSDVLLAALKRRNWGVAASATAILEKMAAGAEAGSVPTEPLVQALTSPDRRAQFAAAKALVGLNPKVPFQGSSQVVPALGRFLLPYSAPRAVVIDGNIYRANEVAAKLKALGYETEAATTGRDGFEAASRSADVELIFLEPTGLAGAWRVADTIANLRADARTAGIPILLNSTTLEVGRHMVPYTDGDPLTEFLVVSPDPRALKTQLDRIHGRMGRRPLGDAERRSMAKEAADLLARIAETAGSPFAAGLDRAGVALRDASKAPGLAPASAATLAEVPTIDAQRDLAELALDSSRPVEIRREAAARLAGSIRKFGPLMTAEQERRLAILIGQTADPATRSSLTEVAEALRPGPSLSAPAPPTDVAPATAVPVPDGPR